MKKKVLLNYLGRKNAGPVFSIEFAKALLLNGYEVSAIVSSGADNIEQWKNLSGLSDLWIMDTYSTNLQFALGLCRLFLIELNKIYKHFKLSSFDYVIRPFYHPWGTFVDRGIKRNKVITVCHDPINHSGYNKIRGLMAGRFIQTSDYIVVLTRSFIPIVHREYGVDEKKIKYMPLGLMKIYKEKQNKSLKYYSKDKINFVFFGRIEKYKGIDILVEAFEKITKQYDNTTLTIAGKGFLDDEIKKRVKTLKNVKVENRYISDDEVGCFFDGPNVCVVLPYTDATQSGVIPIAIEYGTPVIASDTGGLKEQMLDGEFGIYVKPSSVDALFEGMKSVVENPDIMTSQKEKMLAYAHMLEWDQVVGKLMKEIEGESNN